MSLGKRLKKVPLNEVLEVEDRISNVVIRWQNCVDEDEELDYIIKILGYHLYMWMTASIYFFFLVIFHVLLLLDITIFIHFTLDIPSWTFSFGRYVVYSNWSHDLIVIRHIDVAVESFDNRVKHIEVTHVNVFYGKWRLKP